LLACFALLLVCECPAAAAESIDKASSVPSPSTLHKRTAAPNLHHSLHLDSSDSLSRVPLNRHDGLAPIFPIPLLLDNGHTDDKHCRSTIGHSQIPNSIAQLTNRAKRRETKKESEKKRGRRDHAHDA
jgi:hypothetical protein